MTRKELAEILGTTSGDGSRRTAVHGRGGISEESTSGQPLRNRLPTLFEVLHRTREELAERLRTIRGDGSRRTAVLHSLGGIGKESTSEQPLRNRLPTLFEVLHRFTLQPVDLFSFYIYMRDQQRSVDYLDFWYV